MSYKNLSVLSRYHCIVPFLGGLCPLDAGAFAAAMDTRLSGYTPGKTSSKPGLTRNWDHPAPTTLKNPEPIPDPSQLWGFHPPPFPNHKIWTALPHLYGYQFTLWRACLVWLQASVLLLLSLSTYKFSLYSRRVVRVRLPASVLLFSLLFWAFVSH